MTLQIVMLPNSDIEWVNTLAKGRIPPKSRVYSCSDWTEVSRFMREELGIRDTHKMLGHAIMDVRRGRLYSAGKLCIRRAPPEDV